MAGETTEFGRLLTSWRESQGKTKAKLAAEAGLDPSAISRLESGDRGPEWETVARLATALALSPVEHERFIAAAGFRSETVNEPLLVELVELLVDPSLPETVAADVRTLLRIAVDLGRRGRLAG